MNSITSRSEVKRLAGLELNEMLFTKILPPQIFDKSRVSSSGTRIYDTSGELLFNRVQLRKGRKSIGYADIAANPALGAPFLSASHGYTWSERALTKEAVAAARKRRKSIRFDKVRYVAYSYPKIAVQFLRRGIEVLMLELYTWRPIPKERTREAVEPPSNFERWSLLKEIPPSRRRSNIERFQKRIKQWDDLCPPHRPPGRFNPNFISIKEFRPLARKQKLARPPVQRELHYSPDNSDHQPCYELRSQLTNVWCVAASVQMLLDFYRYNYIQTRIATDLGLGTLDLPNGLPYIRDGDVVTVLESLTGNALDATMNTNPSWTEFKNEINANRPLISFIPGHSRTVAGFYTGLGVFGGYFRGLLVYDPWPPSPSVPPTTTTGGIITRWENFNTQTYRVTFTANLS